MTETILVFKRNLVPDLPNKAFFYQKNLLPFLLSNMEFMDRDSAENNFAYKQFIAYSIIRFEDCVVRYRRSAKVRESRLKGLYSIGWGGHVNTTDNVLPLWDSAIISQAMHRELREEINIKTIAPPNLIGFINDDSTDVGKVHFGIVYEYWLNKKALGRKYKQGHEEVGFEKVSDVVQSGDKYEEWSRIIIENHLLTNETITP